MAGVGAGTGAMNSLLGKLAALLGDQYRLLKRIRKEVEFLQREIRRMQALLKTLADMHKLEELEKDWKCNVRELTYDIEDCIDRFMDRLGKGDARPGFVRKTVRRLKNLWERHGIATKIKDLKARVIEESQRRDRSSSLLLFFLFFSFSCLSILIAGVLPKIFILCHLSHTSQHAKHVSTNIYVKQHSIFNNQFSQN
jgi:signal transduction histidine kinase